MGSLDGPKALSDCQCVAGRAKLDMLLFARADLRGPTTQGHLGWLGRSWRFLGAEALKECLGWSGQAILNVRWFTADAGPKGPDTNSSSEGLKAVLRG